MFPKSFGLALVTIKSTRLESTGVAALLASFKIMKTVSSWTGIALAQFVRKRGSWRFFS